MPAAGEYFSQGLRLDRITDFGSSPVRLDIIDVRAFQAGAGQCAPDDVGLPRHRRHRLAGGAVPGVADRAPPNDCSDAITVFKGCGQRLQQDKATALAPHVAVRTPIERVGVARRRHRTEFCFEHCCFGCQIEVDPAGYGKPGRAGVQVFTCLVDRDQRRRLPGIHGHAGALQSEGVRDPVSDHSPADSGEGVMVEGVLAITQRQERIVIGHCAEEDRNQFPT